MAGIYLHIPFCKQACHYCDFHFSTSLRYRERMVEALLWELELRHDYLAGQTIETIYFGGGTPSLLPAADIERLLNAIGERFSVAEGAEITLEANPDDLTEARLAELAASPVNRLSIGLQSFDAEDLRFFNRAHSAEEAARCLELALRHGFADLSVDLIYGSPTTSDATWHDNLQRILDYRVPHLSCYCLTVEPNTALEKFVRNGTARPVEEEQAARQFEYLLEWSEAAGYEQYEISNFARDERYSRHNTAYWLGKHYLGIGPSAHSFDGVSRSWNVSNNALYMKHLENGGPYRETEHLSATERYNEYLMTALRTRWGVDLQRIRTMGFEEQFLRDSQAFLQRGHLERHADLYRLTGSGKLLADGIAAQLFAV